jgi:mono/diheme cytochrome c family protein
MNTHKTIFSLSFLAALFGLLMVEGIAHEWMAPKKIAETKNPIALDDKSFERGKKVYSQNCASCHGTDKKGMSAEETGLGVSPPNLKKRIATHSDGDFFWKIQQGRNDMPAFNNDLTKQQIWDVINYIRSDAE